LARIHASPHNEECQRIKPFLHVVDDLRRIYVPHTGWKGRLVQDKAADIRTSQLLVPDENALCLLSAIFTSAH